MTVAGGLALVCLGAFSQAQPPSAGDAGKGGSRQIDPYAQAVQQLELILVCKPGTKIDAKAVEARLEAFGMRKADGGVFLPPANTQAISLFGDEVLAADVTDSDGEKKVSVYLKRQSGKQMAKKLGVSRINEFASTDEASYFKETSKKTTLMVGSADELPVGNSGKSIRFNSAVACQMVK
jgi:hypothetical protein